MTGVARQMVSAPEHPLGYGFEYRGKRPFHGTSVDAVELRSAADRGSRCSLPLLTARVRRRGRHKNRTAPNTAGNEKRADGPRHRRQAPHDHSLRPPPP